METDKTALLHDLMGRFSRRDPQEYPEVRPHSTEMALRHAFIKGYDLRLFVCIAGMQKSRT
ncbi:hypothetical protein HBA94_00730 [Ochrobactrum sp. GRS2]|nr:hypothetical protein [Ochrobactrum sp. GRS2]